VMGWGGWLGGGLEVADRDGCGGDGLVWGRGLDRDMGMVGS